MKKKLWILFTVTLLLLFTALPVSAAPKKLNYTKKTLTVSAQFQLKVSGKSKKPIVWISSKPSVATVSKKGLVKAKKPGKTTITARSGKKKLTCQITVKAPEKKVKTGYSYNKKYGSGPRKDSISLGVLKVSGNKIQFLLTFMSASGRMADTNVITAKLNGNRVSRFSWRDSNNRTGKGSLTFGKKKVTINMTSPGYYLWPRGETFKYKKTLSKADIKRLKDGWL